MDNEVNASASTGKEISLTRLASMVNGRIVGGPTEEVKLTGTCAVDYYIRNRVAFVKNLTYGEILAELRNAVILIPENLVELCERYPQNIYIVVGDVLNSMMDVQDAFYGDQFLVRQQGISPTATIGKDARLGNDVYIGENVHIGVNVTIGDGTKIMHNCCISDDVVIGERTYIYPAACIYSNCQIGHDCIIHAGVCIGVDGFRFEQDRARKTVRKWLHMGNVIVGDRVEMCANCTIARATFPGDSTIISDDVKVNNQVHIAHNAKVGRRTLIAAQASVCGSAKIGEDVWLGAGVTISNGVRVGNGAKILLNAVVAYNVPEGEMVSGFYAMPHRRWKQAWRTLRDGI